MIGKQLAHYEILEKIGEGGMGAVYRAHDPKLDRDVAIKVLPAELTENVERTARFAREARTLASLQHPNIASVYGFEDSAEISFLVMELVEGEDLATRLTRGPVPVDEAVEIAHEVAQGLEAAHEQGIVHRDLKPANIQLADDGAVKILDFGLARAYTGEPDGDTDPARSPTITAAMTQAGTILGTAAYMSPEQARGKAVDRRADIWAFGVVLFEILTGRRLFEGETASDTLAAVLRAEVELDDLPIETPPALRMLLTRCLERDPRRRLRDIGEARVMLDAVKAGDSSASILMSGVLLPEDGADSSMDGKARGREKFAWLLVGILAVVGVIGFLGGRGTSSDDPAQLRRLSIPLTGEVDLQYSHRGLVISPDATHVAYINHRKLFVRDLSSWDAVEIAESEGATTPFWSPDGTWLAFGVDNSFWKVRVDGSQRSLIGKSDQPHSTVGGGAWLSDGRIVYRGQVDLLTIPASGGSPSVFISAEAESLTDFHEPVALPGGDGILTILHREEGPDTIGLVSLAGELSVLLSFVGSSPTRPWYSSSGHVLLVMETEMWAVAVDLSERKVSGEPFTVLRNAATPSVSRDGTLAYVRGAGAILRQLVLVDRQGEIQTRFGQPSNPWAVCALSPDGTRAIASGSTDEDLWIHDERGAMVRVSFTGQEHDMPAFSPDGSQVYFSSGSPSEYWIGRKSVDGDQSEEVVVPAGEMGPAYYAACPAPTADGTRLFYTVTNADDDSDIAWLDLSAESSPQVFITGSGDQNFAQPAPHDDRYVAYVSTESGSGQVYLTTWPDASRRHQVSIEGGYWPRWKRDGSELYFARGNEIYAVSVSYDPLVLGRPELLFRRPEQDDRQPFGWPAGFDVSADGERFLTTELVIVGGMDPHIAIVEDWTSTLPE